MSVSYVAVYEKGGNSTPTAAPTATGQVKGIDRLCLTNQNSLNRDSTLRTKAGCLGVVGGTNDGFDVDWYPCNGTTAQTWTHKPNGELVNPHANLCLTDPHGNTGSRLDIETCAHSAQQIWTLPSGTRGSCGTTKIASHLEVDLGSTRPCNSGS
jgi:hypothetical protein